MAKKKAKTKKAKGKKSKAGNLMGVRFILIVLILLAVLFLPTTVLLCIGMLPTFVVFFVSMGGKKSKAVTVGSVNFAGCAAFVFELWTLGGDFPTALNIALDPNNIMIMYGAALVGYLVDWALTGIVAGVLRERGKGQLKSIKKQQAALVDRWGDKVKGDVPLDEHGFPIGK